MSPETKVIKKLVTVPEVAEFLSTTHEAIYRMTSPTRPNPIPHKHLGRLLRFDLDEVAAWVESGGDAAWDADLRE